MINLMSGNSFENEFKNWIEGLALETIPLGDDWVLEKLSENMRDKNKIQVEKIYVEILDNIDKYERNKENIETVYLNGISKEEWLANKLKNAVEEESITEKILILNDLRLGLFEALGISVENKELENELYINEENFLANSIGEMVIARIMQVLGEDDESTREFGVSKFVTDSLSSHNDNKELKKLTSSVLVSLVQTGKAIYLPSNIPVGILVHVACFAIDNTSIFLKIAKREMSLTEALCIISQNAVSSIFGMLTNKENKISKDRLAGTLCFLKEPLRIVNEIMDTVFGFVDMELRDRVKAVKRRFMPTACSLAKRFVERTVITTKNIFSKVKNFLFS